jgi:hypothetical protein
VAIFESERKEEEGEVVVIVTVRVCFAINIIGDNMLLLAMTKIKTEHSIKSVFATVVA